MSGRRRWSRSISVNISISSWIETRSSPSVPCDPWIERRSSSSPSKSIPSWWHCQMVSWRLKGTAMSDCISKGDVMLLLSINSWYPWFCWSCRPGSIDTQVTDAVVNDSFSTQTDTHHWSLDDDDGRSWRKMRFKNNWNESRRKQVERDNRFTLFVTCWEMLREEEKFRHRLDISFMHKTFMFYYQWSERRLANNIISPSTTKTVKYCFSWQLVQCFPFSSLTQS